MAIPSSLALDIDAVLSTTLFNVRRNIEDEISTSNALLYQLMRRQGGGWVGMSSIGDRAQIPLMYELGTADAYAGYDQLSTDPMDGISSAYFDWRQAAVPIAISGLEELKNSGEAQIVSLLKAKTKQALLGLEDFFGKALLQGNGGSAITTAKTSSTTGAVFIDPLPLLVKYDPTSSTSIGNINQSTYTWWANQTTNSASTTYAGFLKEVSHMNNLCSKGPGGAPNMWVADVNVYELYEAALRAQHRNPSYAVADLPFANLSVYASPLVWDEFVPDAANGSATQSTSSGTLYALNTKFWQIQYHKSRAFSNTPFVRPENQDARVAHILFLGAACVSNRRKQGVIGSIDTTIAS